MEILSILIIFLLFMLPPMLIMRSQRKRAAEVQAMRGSIVPGDRVVTVAGVHGSVVKHEPGSETLELEIAPGVVITLETAGVMKKVASLDPEPMP